MIAAAAVDAGGPAAGPREPLSNAVRITSPERFVKAGEAYFSPDGRWVVFQAIPADATGEAAERHYQIYTARLRRDADGRVVGTEAPIRLSPEGSANTCAWFHPKTPWRLIFGSTIDPPASEAKAGYQRGRNDYVWDFPEQMEVCTRSVPAIFEDLNDPGQTGLAPAWGLDARRPVPLFERDGYDAECAYSPDGRFIVYTHVDPDSGDGDIWIYDIGERRHVPIVTEEGYDGGPFFSPDGTRLCYRSDRQGNDLLQVYVADLAFDERGRIVGMEAEHQVTSNRHVNWAPYWSPDADLLVYATSEIGHRNYEVFAAWAPGERPEGGSTEPWRVTHAAGFDGLPVISPDGSLLMWTSQRLPDAEGAGSSQVWIAEIDLDAVRRAGRE